MRMKRRNEEVNYSRLIGACPKATLNPETNRTDQSTRNASTTCHVRNEKGTFGGTFVVHSGYIRVHSDIFRYIRKNSVTIRPTKNQHFRKVLQIWQVHSPHAPQPFIILKGEIAQDALITSWDASKLLEFYVRFCSWFLSAGFFLFPSPTLPSPPFRPTLPPDLATRRCA